MPANGNDPKGILECSLAQFFGEGLHAASACRTDAANSPIRQFANSPIHQLLPSPLRAVFVCAFNVLRDRDRIVRQTLIVDTIAVGIPDLFIGRFVALYRAFVNVLIVLLWRGGRVHGDSC
jgi:hypothetical protein